VENNWNGIEKMKNFKRYRKVIFFVYFSWGLILLHFFLHQNLYSQATGFKYMENYNSGQHPLNWAVIQDKRGIIYVANNGCVLGTVKGTGKKSNDFCLSPDFFFLSIKNPVNLNGNSWLF
jgi:hypothetical protein